MSTQPRPSNKMIGSGKGKSFWPIKYHVQSSYSNIEKKIFPEPQHYCRQLLGSISEHLNLPGPEACIELWSLLWTLKLITSTNELFCLLVHLFGLVKAGHSVLTSCSWVRSFSLHVTYWVLTVSPLWREFWYKDMSSPFVKWVCKLVKETIY